jgi:hypothetical protein
MLGLRLFFDMNQFQLIGGGAVDAWTLSAIALDGKFIRS